MFAVDISTLVRDALKENGCEQMLQGDLDSHSTIALDLHRLPSIYITNKDGEVWLWSQLIEHNDNVFDQCSTRLLNVLMQGCSFVRGEQLQLAVNDGYLELRGLLQANSLRDGQSFSEALDGYLELLERFVEAVQ
ncbi:InvB/SpaK family type III secretion system chaperone [Iodobacter fluviatilis]|uniref:Invasion protein B family protein n=1 Tax=Iodobacter fluviatilis TaxID=537 RepID=A0A377Q6I3_9NEIS|nr:type III secretion system chaperone SpaK [Iodobacter fluviatilis]TCU86888.1 invasion protein B family protein [Iodobacter fluviatilis]STQ90219.1 Invasion protein invB [Iodobacter fluviatilis]